MAAWIGKPAVDCDLTVVALQAAEARLLLETGRPPTSLGCGPFDCRAAWDVVTQLKSRMVVVIIPGLPIDYWFVCNDGGIYWSPGA